MLNPLWYGFSFHVYFYVRAKKNEGTSKQKSSRCRSDVAFDLLNILAHNVTTVQACAQHNCLLNSKLLIIYAVSHGFTRIRTKQAERYNWVFLYTAYRISWISEVSEFYFLFILMERVWSLNNNIGFLKLWYFGYNMWR